MKAEWKFDLENIDWNTVSHLYKIAPLGDKKPEDLRTVFGNSRYTCFAFRGGQLIGAGRALADGVDCAYICDVVVHPECQGTGIGKGIMKRLMELSRGHKKIILYSNPGKEGFYEKLGFRSMKTAMAIFQDQAAAAARGFI
ncbi:MAG: GNAT family N-acetyltransferase [Desulfobacterales bacterium]|nr:GNAT family N-acetyltransferase [Desulfobacterales bacterium]